MTHRNDFGPTKQFLLKHAPNFCWVSAYDLQLMVEQELPETGYSMLRKHLCELKQRGHFITKTSHRTDAQERLNEDVAFIPGRLQQRLLYLRVS